MREIRIQPLLIRRSIDFPSPLSPSSPRTPNTPGFFEDLGSLDPSLYTMVAEVRPAGVLFEYLVKIQRNLTGSKDQTQPYHPVCLVGYVDLCILLMPYLVTTLFLISKIQLVVYYQCCVLIG